ncbi:MAG: phosphoglucosamine mutase [Sphingobacteriales bacterium UTBCD1]|jgi:phosphomannomutase|nr:MAG: phosphoglucosamine mutase [Sphingobacteriales bacterium UTBCD1]
MPLIKSISGIRGTIGDKPGENLTPADVEKFSAAFASLLLENYSGNNGDPKMVIGRDGRTSGGMIRDIVAGTLAKTGVDVIDLGLSTTPTVEIAVKMERAMGGIIITASHNPAEWNALKLLNSDGEFISADLGKRVLERAKEDIAPFSGREGKIIADDSYLHKHIDAILNYPLVNAKAIAKRNFKVVVDAINSTGAIFVPALLKALGVKDVIVLNAEVNGKFAHNPEPLPEHLAQLSNEVIKSKADLGIAVDPDVDRLCFVCEDGTMFGEEYTLVSVADYVLNNKKGNTVSNLSSTKALKEVTHGHGCNYFPSAVGEVNVVNKMKEVNAVIGGEGNGGVIVPDFHYGRDALIGIGLFLSHLAGHKKGMKSFRNLYPDYFIAKKKIELQNGYDLKSVFDSIKKKYKKNPINTDDGLKIEFDGDWVHLRSSNTEPIIRIYAESNFETKANNIAMQLMRDIRESM